MVEYRFTVKGTSILAKNAYNLNGRETLRGCRITVQFEKPFDDGVTLTGVIVETSFPEFLPKGKRVTMTRAMSDVVMREN